MNENIVQQFQNGWNRRLKSIRTTGFIISILMVVLGILCFVYPVQSVYTMEIIASILIICLGVFEIAEYHSLPVFIRMGGGLVSGILNVFAGILLLTSPAEEMLYAFAFLLAAELLVFGIEEISFASKLKFYGVTNAGWVILNGVLNILMSVLFFVLPMASVITLGLYAALYLLTGGVTLFIECVSAKELKAE